MNRNAFLIGASAAVIANIMVGCGGGAKNKPASRSDSLASAKSPNQVAAAPTTESAGGPFIRPGQVISTDDLIRLVEQRRRELEAAGQLRPPAPAGETASSAGSPKPAAPMQGDIPGSRAVSQPAEARSRTAARPPAGESLFHELGNELSLGDGYNGSSHRSAAESTNAQAPAQPTTTPTERAASDDAGGGANSRVELTRAPTDTQAAVPPVQPQPKVMPQTQPSGRVNDAQPASLQQISTADALLERLQQQVKDNPRDLATHLDFQLYEFLRDKPVPDLTAAAPLPQEDRELLMAIMDSLSNFRSAVQSDSNLLLGKKMAPLLALEERLRRQAELEIPTIALCTKIDRFGTYMPITPPKFAVRGSNNRFAVYCEVQNFATRQNGNGMWETNLVEECVLYNESGGVVWQGTATPVTDLSRNRRHDFYCYEIVQLAPSLPAGKYVLKMTITDQQSKRVAEATTSLEIVKNSL